LPHRRAPNGSHDTTAARRPARPAPRTRRGISATATEIREIRAKLTPQSLRRLKEHLFKLQLSLITNMIAGDINTAKISTISDCARVIEVLDVLQVSTRSLSR
jgi:hypothetical protein